MTKINLSDWLDQLNEDGAYGTGTQSQTGAPGGSTTGDLFGGSPASSPGGDPNVANMPTSDNERKDQQEEIPDVADDPQVPDMPDMDEEELDFEQWKKKFLVESIKGDVQDMKSMLMSVRDRDLEPYQRKFVEDNLQIIFAREHSNVDKASKEIRKLIKDDLDHNNPATSVVNHLTEVLETAPLLNSIYIKISGLRGMKGDIHREFLAALTGSVQVGSGGYNEDLIFNEKEYSIRISTRFNSRFGEVVIGPWSLKVDDADRYLDPGERRRLEDGSPEEKVVLRRRVIMESIAEAYKTRAFIFNVVGSDGTVYTIGWDLANSLKAAYTEGRLIVRTPKDDSTEAMIDDDGAIIELPQMKVFYTKETGEVDEDGNPHKEEIEFMEKKYGQLMLTADLKTLKEAASSFQGLVFKQTPWTGNPSDLMTLMRCVPSLPEIIMRQC